MPDPGEPHRPERENFASDDDYLDALEEYVQIMYPPEEIRTFALARRGVQEIEQFLEEHSGR